MLYAQQNQISPRRQYLQTRASRLRPDYPEALNNLGVLLFGSRTMPKAEEQFKSCIRVAPEFRPVLSQSGPSLRDAERKGKSREVLQELLRVQPDNAGAKQAMEMLQ